MTKNNNKNEYEQLGRLLAVVYETGYLTTKRMFALNFLRGVAVGLGSVVGATLLAGLIVWVLSLFDTIPLIGPAFENIKNSIEQ